ncbi:MAG: O-antigen ligase family protein [Phycisphaerales bacterium]|nr:O-antigen ligase family protein [Phycisphaerales bacterium]
MDAGHWTERSTGFRRTHACVLGLALASLPIGGIDTISMCLTVAAAVLALPWWRRLWPLLKSWPLLAWALWWGLWGVSSTWTQWPVPLDWEPAVALLLAPACLPMIGRRRWWVWPILAGICGQCALQILDATGVMGGAALGTWWTHTGLYWYPANVGLWGTVALVLAVDVLVSHRSSRWCVAIGVLASLASIIVVWLTLNRTTALLCALAVGLFLGRVMWPRAAHRGHRKQVIALAVFAASIISGILFTNDVFRIRMSRVAGEVQRTLLPGESHVDDLDRFNSGLGIRVVWWHAGWQSLCRSPVLGHGGGSTEHTLAVMESEMPSQWGAAIPGFLTRNPHAIWIRAAIETGALGLLCVGVVLLGGVGRAWRCRITNTIGRWLGPSFVAVVLFSVLHALTIEWYTASLVTLLLVVTAVESCSEYHMADGCTPG